MKSLVLFDLDGTFMDTSDGIILSIEYMMNQLGIKIPDRDDLKRYIGPPIEDSIKKYIGFDDAQTKKAAAIFREVYQNKFLYKAKIYPSLERLPERLHEQGIKCGIATFKRESYTLKLLRHFGLTKKFDVIHGSDDKGVMSKSDIINMCILQTDENPENTVMIGDTVHDAKAARKSGVDFIAVTYGYGFQTAEDLKSQCCKKVVGSSENLYSCFASIR